MVVFLYKITIFHEFKIKIIKILIKGCFQINNGKLLVGTCKVGI